MKNYRGEMTKKYDTMKFNKAGNSFDYVEEEMGEGNAFTDALRKTKKGEKFKLGNKEYMDRSSLDEFEEEMEEGNAFTDALRKTKKGEKFKLGNKEYMDRSSLDEEPIYEFEVNESDVCECGGLKMEGECSECGMKESNLLEFEDEGYEDLSVYETELEEDMYDNMEKTSDFWNKGEKTFRTKMYEYEIFNDKLGRTVRLSEEQVVNLIETLSEEKLKPSKKTRGYSEYERSFDKSGKENQDYYKEVSKKMKDYMKDGSKESFTMEPKHFPMGNGEIEEMDKMAYVPSDSVAEYVENFTAAALENLEYDEFAPNKEWVEDNIVGSSRTGNNPKWGNSVETPTNKRRNEIREKNLLGQLKKKAYNKSPQPIVKDRPGSDDASDLLNKVESGEKRSTKKSKKINEDLERIGNLISYGRKTQ